ncbi:MAG TPA: helix-turn-helix transcriptional regulator [Steroidobacteraceae bacterium]|nr:helix-turn-helix transcriptional regulator [Steroidobacteraceae bacterium]
MTLDLLAIGNEIRRSRLARGLTQGQLAAAARITRTTLNQLESGLVKDLGIRKVQAVLEALGLALAVDRPAKKSPNYLRLASTAASVSFKTAITERELLHALLTGKVPSNRRPHIRALLDEAPRALLNGLIRQVSHQSIPGKVERNLGRLAAALGLPGNPEKWLPTRD